MPSIVSSYIYTLVALVAVSALLLYSVNSYAATLRETSENDQLRNILNAIATRADEVLTLIADPDLNASVAVYIDAPARIGDKQYWMRVRNDSSSTWVEGALGNTAQSEAELQVSLASKASASGSFISGYGRAMLQGYLNGSAPQLRLASAGG